MVLFLVSWLLYDNFVVQYEGSNMCMNSEEVVGMVEGGLNQGCCECKSKSVNQWVIAYYNVNYACANVKSIKSNATP